EISFVQSLADLYLYKYLERDIILLVYIDDLVVSAKTCFELDWFFLIIKRRFLTKDLGEISKILGIRITRNRHVGSVIFAIVETRPDIAFVTSQLSQQLRDPAERHSNGIRDLGRYLQSTINQKIKYRPVADSDSNLKLYSDAD
ncbi:hypothetical protein LSUE1_G009284, partial [Lachnellula suecica]